jgi:hypothetical protein
LNLESELQFRLSSAADFLVGTWNGDTFVHSYERDKQPSDKIHLTHNLHAISALISLSEYLGRRDLRNIADEAFNGIRSFSNNEHKFIVHDEKSLLIWNALATIIHVKRGELEEATAFANSIVECIGGDAVSSIYPPDFEQQQGWYAEAILALILLSAKSKCEDMGDAAAYIGNLLLEKGIIPNHYEAWAYTLLYSIEQYDRYLKRVKKQVEAFKQPTIKAMTSLFAACAQQTFFAAYPRDTWIAKSKCHADQLRLELLDQQVALQVDKDKDFGWTPAHYGAFILRKTRPNIRLDYVIQNAMAIMQYLSHLTNQKITAII